MEKKTVDTSKLSIDTLRCCIEVANEGIKEKLQAAAKLRVVEQELSRILKIRLRPEKERIYQREYRRKYRAAGRDKWANKQKATAPTNKSKN